MRDGPGGRGGTEVGGTGIGCTDVGGTEMGGTEVGGLGRLVGKEVLSSDTGTFLCGLG